MSKHFRPIDRGGVTRNPWHPSPKNLFATNFMKLEFRLNGEHVDPKYIETAYTELNYMVMFKANDQNQIVFSNNIPETYKVKGMVQVEGTAVNLCKSCGHSISSYRIQRWWEVQK